MFKLILNHSVVLVLFLNPIIPHTHTHTHSQTLKASFLQMYRFRNHILTYINTNFNAEKLTIPCKIRSLKTFSMPNRQATVSRLRWIARFFPGGGGIRARNNCCNLSNTGEIHGKSRAQRTQRHFFQRFSRNRRSLHLAILILASRIDSRTWKASRGKDDDNPSCGVAQGSG